MPRQDYFADGMTDELTASLARIDTLRILSRTTMNQYRRSHKPVPQIARELNVDGVIEGSVVRSGDKVGVTPQLIDARLDRHLWAQSYERQLTNILEVQDAIALDVASRYERPWVRGLAELQSPPPRSALRSARMRTTTSCVAATK